MYNVCKVICALFKIYSKFTGNIEAGASEFLENLEEMFPRYYIDIDVVSRFKYLTTHRCVTRRGRATKHFRNGKLVRSIDIHYTLNVTSNKETSFFLEEVLHVECKYAYV